MSITPYNVQAFRDGKWVEVISSELVPGDLVSVCEWSVMPYTILPLIPPMQYGLSLILEYPATCCYYVEHVS